MKKLFKVIGILVLINSCNTSYKADNTEIVIKNVNLIPMTSEVVLENRSVYISNGKIKDIGDIDSITFPDNAYIINGKGKYLTPGFSDMHTHIEYKEELNLFLANGVTTIRQMWGTPLHLELRTLIQRGEILGPDIFTAGPLTDGENYMWEGSYVLTDPEKVEDYVAKVKSDGYDFIKVYDNLSPEVFRKICEFSIVYDIPVIGHVPFQVNTEDAINLNMYSLEHLYGYDLWNTSIVGLSDLIDLTVESGVWNCPTLTVLNTMSDLLYRGSNPDKYTVKSIPELKYVSKSSITWWESSYGAETNFGKAKALLNELHGRGANIVSGTDQANPYVIAGFSIHDEFKLLNNAGLSNYEVLLTTTVNPAKMLGIEDRSGTIEIGKDADMVLLNENPLEDIKNTKEINGVLSKGKWLDSRALNKMLDEVEELFSN